MNEPLVSISVSSYGNAHFIEETLDSIYNQTYSNIELVIVDDFSKDNSIEVINNWVEKNGKRFQNVNLICHEKNMGVCVVANAMIKNSGGKYISIIASDDSMLPDKTEKQVSFLEKSSEDVGMIYSDAYLMNEKSEMLPGKFIQRYRPDLQSGVSGWIFNDLVEGNFIPAMSVLIKKEVIEKIGAFDENLVYEDYDMWLRISSKYQIVFCNDTLVKYRLSSNSLTNKIKNWNPSLIRLMLKHRESEATRKKLIQIALLLYKENDYENLKLFKELEFKIGIIKDAIIFCKYNIPYFIGIRIISKKYNTQ